MSTTSATVFAQWRTWAAVAAATLLLCGCSSTRLAYERLDWLARWQLGHYVSLTAPQKAWFEQHFGAVWTWHRQTQLPVWSAELRALADDLDAGAVTRDDVAARFARYGEFWRRIKRQLSPLACGLGPQLTDAQIDEILGTADEELEELRRDSLEPDPDDARRDALRAVEKPLRSWLGRLSEEQRALIRRWNNARPPVARPWFEYRQSWRMQLETVLRHRHEPGFCDRASTLIGDGSSLWTDAQRRAFDENRNRWIDLFVQLVPTLDDRQRDHARRRLLDLADDFDALAPPGPGTGA